MTIRAALDHAYGEVNQEGAYRASPANSHLKRCTRSGPMVRHCDDHEHADSLTPTSIGAIGTEVYQGIKT
jgi:hypothetical protein